MGIHEARTAENAHRLDVILVRIKGNMSRIAEKMKRLSPRADRAAEDGDDR